MCGIWGVVGRFSDADVARFVEIASEVQGHRGPDSVGHQVVAWNGQDRVLLGHQRLSIIDLSDAGCQPMWSASGQSGIVFNGEIYNYLELARDRGLSLRSASDTEVLIEIAEREGLDAALEQANGMWALLWMSRSQGRLALARDRAGKKPLYIHRTDDRFIFASELKTVAALSGERFRIEPQMVADYIDQGLQDVDTRSWLRGIESLPQGSVATLERCRTGWSVEITSQWSPAPRQVDGLAQSIDAVRDLVADSISLRLRSDVPVGVTLSGGIDSSIIAAELARMRGDPAQVHAISAVSPGQAGDESTHIDAVCNALGITSHRVDLAWDPAETWELLDRVTWHNDAPIGSFSNIAFYRLMKEARARGLKVVLSGQGADEIFCGYRKFFPWALTEFARRGRFDLAAANLVGSLRHGTVVTQLNLAEARRYLPGGTRSGSILTSALRSQTRPRSLGMNGRSVGDRQLADFRQFSVPYLTHYEDRGSMAHGVEVRLPFLDYRLVETALSLPTEYKVRGGWTKFVLRKAFADRLPASVIWRRDKQGFSNPQEQWLKGPLRPAFDAFFRSDAEVFRRGLLDRAAASAKWDAFLAGTGSVWNRDVFAPVALESWLKNFAPYLED